MFSRCCGFRILSLKSVKEAWQQSFLRRLQVDFEFYILLYQSIVDLMDVLELRKHEAILFTFKQVPYFLSLNLPITPPPFVSPPLPRKRLNFGNHKTTWHPSKF